MGYVARMEETKKVYKVFIGIPDLKRTDCL